MVIYNCKKLTPLKRGDLMEKTKVRIYCFYDDRLEVLFQYDEDCDKYFGDYPDFEESPRFTQTGRPWVNAVQDACLHSTSMHHPYEQCMDCGSCIHFRKEAPDDLIGVCDNQLKRKN